MRRNGASVFRLEQSLRKPSILSIHRSASNVRPVSQLVVGAFHQPNSAWNLQAYLEVMLRARQTRLERYTKRRESDSEAAVDRQNVLPVSLTLHVEEYLGSCRSRGGQNLFAVLDCECAVDR